MEAKIIGTRHNIFRNHNFYTFEWVGPKTATALIGRRLYDKYKNQLPWKLKIVEENLPMDSYVVARADSLLCISAICHWIKTYTKRTASKTKQRIIITAMIWNLAYVPDNEIPQWKHIGKRFSH